MVNQTKESQAEVNENDVSMCRTESTAGMEETPSWRELNGAHSPQWRQVFELLPVFRAARLNERRAAEGSTTEARNSVALLN